MFYAEPQILEMTKNKDHTCVLVKNYSAILKCEENCKIKC